MDEIEKFNYYLFLKHTTDKTIRMRTIPQTAATEILFHLHYVSFIQHDKDALLRYLSTKSKTIYFLWDRN